MATFTVQDIVNVVQRRLYDANDSYRRWADDYYIDGVNAAVTAITAARPDTVSETAVLQLASGRNEYFIPGLGSESYSSASDASGLPTGQAFVRVVRITDSAGTAAGRAVREAPLDQMDASHPDWSLDTGSVTHFIRSPDTKKFFMYPTPSTAQHVSVIYTREPALVSATTDTVDLPGQYLAAVASYVAYYILRMETTDESAFQKADAYYKEYLHNAGFEITQGGSRAQQDAQLATAKGLANKARTI